MGSKDGPQRDAPDCEERRLDQLLLAAHEARDAPQLARCYFAAANASLAAGRVDEACFRYTQAYVFALECGETGIAEKAKAELLAQGREE